MTGLIGVVYRSRAAGLMTPLEIEQLLARARVRNARLGVSGMLLHSDTTFVQYLEGPDTAVHEVMASVSRDPRHEDIHILLDGPIERREFGQWSMGYVSMFASDRRLMRSRLGLDTPGKDVRALQILDEFLGRGAAPQPPAADQAASGDPAGEALTPSSRPPP